MAKAEPKGWINWLDWVSPPAARFGPRSQALPVAILWFPVRTHRPIPPPAQNLLVSPITLDLATCNLQLAICDCDRRLATWQLALAADNSLVELLSVDCPEPGALHRPTQRRTVAAACLRIGSRPDERNAADIGLTVTGVLSCPLSLPETSLNPAFDETNSADIPPPIARTVLRMRARSTRLEATAQKITRLQRRFRAPKEYASGAAAPPRLCLLVCQ